MTRQEQPLLIKDFLVAAHEGAVRLRVPRTTVHTAGL